MRRTGSVGLSGYQQYAYWQGYIAGQREAAGLPLLHKPSSDAVICGERETYEKGREAGLSHPYDIENESLFSKRDHLTSKEI